MINNVIIEGWLNNIQARKTGNGKSATTGTISTPRSKDQQTGKWTYDYISFTAYEAEADFLQALGDKAKVILVGRWRHDSVQDPNTKVWKNYDKLLVSAVAFEGNNTVANNSAEKENADSNFTPPDFDINFEELPF